MAWDAVKQGRKRLSVLIGNMTLIFFKLGNMTLRQTKSIRDLFLSKPSPLPQPFEHLATPFKLRNRTARDSDTTIIQNMPTKLGDKTRNQGKAVNRNRYLGMSHLRRTHNSPHTMRYIISYYLKVKR